MTDIKMRLVDWLDDLCVRFIVNLPHEELQSVERICFQIEEAQWFYEDFIRPLDPTLPSLNLRRFALLMFQHCPLSSSYSELHHTQAYEDFLAYKTRVPVRGAIMLNHDMTHAVLVKGWKKGAKWSFPRGKINKDEPDLDCAVREVYEETGYDLKAANLVGTEETTKKISVNMREQNMVLYVFRSVPMDTHFEPRTRKEISKIDWYRLTDLPTLKTRKNQLQQGAGHDLVKENNFYMVAPFMGPLKGWIKQQQKVDRQKARTGAHMTPSAPAGVTDTEELEADLDETTADEGPLAEMQPDDGNFAQLVARLGRGGRSSDALPEVSAHQEPQIMDPAAELKRLLSVGPSFSQEAPPVEAPVPNQTPHGNSLVAMLQANNRPPVPLPRTPIDQIMPPPLLPQTPHGQHHPRPPQINHISPPPPFPFQTQYPHQFRGPPPPPPHMLPQHYNSHPMQFQHQFIPPHHTNQIFPPRPPNMQEAEAFGHQVPRPYQRTGDPQFATGPQFPGHHTSAIPAASNLPLPKLNAHTRSLLNAFKMNEKPATSPPQQTQATGKPQMTPRSSQPPALNLVHESFASPGLINVEPYVPSPPPFMSPPQHANFQPVQPKPRSAHQDSLLTLFRSPSVPANPTPPPKSPAELSAQPKTPGHMNAKPSPSRAVPAKPDLTAKLNLLELFGAPTGKSNLTSATVSGPVNAPDFDTVRKNTHSSGVNGHGTSRGPSPSSRKTEEPKMFIPQQILRREISSTPKDDPRDNTEVRRSRSPKAKIHPPAQQTTSFKPQVLRRPQQNASQAPVQAPVLDPQPRALLELFKTATPPPAAPTPPVRFPAPPAPQQSFDRRETLPLDQKNVLLSLFGKPTQGSTSPTPVVQSPVHLDDQPAQPLPSSVKKSPIPLARSPQPPTPTNMMSGVISPVSPLPEKGSQQNSPAHLASRSRISSIGESMPPSIVIPRNLQPTSHPNASLNPTSKNGIEEGYSSTGSTSASLTEKLAVDKPLGKASAVGEATGKSPVDKTFLLGFLEDVARRAR